MPCLVDCKSGINVSRPHAQQRKQEEDVLSFFYDHVLCRVVSCRVMSCVLGLYLLEYVYLPCMHLESFILPPFNCCQRRGLKT